MHGGFSLTIASGCVVRVLDVLRAGQRLGRGLLSVDNWRRHFAGLEPVDIKRLRALEGENARVKRTLLDR
jgi:putative transposase